MSEQITISKLARLMNVSTHQIRYFEEKGILFPENIEENGYRMYGVKDIYTLAHILLLRKLNIPVSSIKECLTDYTPDDYTQLFHSSLEQLNEQINNLLELKNLTIGMIQKLSKADQSKDQYVIKPIENRTLKQIGKMNHDEELSAKQFYDLMNEPNNASGLYETDIISLYDHEYVYLCIEADGTNMDGTHQLKAGKYLCYGFLAKDEKDFESQLNQFFEYAQTHQIKLKGRLIAIENTILSICYNNEVYCELQMLVE
ncbi:MerR family transcriptional regulator [Brevibacillus ginsengisoli]|uniref:helix-turn-helix domain-containing protein n=1 Tax=Brevibacillus ginsengisoli TaxID=363854 RepID=UPI003CF984C9